MYHRFLVPRDKGLQLAGDSTSGFRFTDCASDVDITDSLVVRIPRGILRKRDLLKELASQLKFPQYFGWNWDALEECLADLSWIKEPRRIVLMHDQAPFRGGSQNRETYFRILEQAIATWGADDDHELIVVLPQACAREFLQSE